jgi:hypothetical protein
VCLRSQGKCLSLSFAQDRGTVTLSVTIPAMRKVFKTRHFSCWMRKTELTDQTLCAAVVAMEAGLDEICDDN